MTPRDKDGRERIISEASRLFASKGYDGVSMREVAEASGMTKAALYYHFENKESLYFSAVQSLLQQILLALESASGEGSWEARLVSSANAIANAIASRGMDLLTLIRDLGRFAPAEGSWREQMGDVVLDPVISAIEDGIEAGELEPRDPTWLAWMLVALVTVGARPLVGKHDPAVVDMAVKLFLEGARREG